MRYLSEVSKNDRMILFHFQGKPFNTSLCTNHKFDPFFWVRYFIFVFFYKRIIHIGLEQIRQWHPTPVFLPGKSHGRRSLEGCSPWGRWGSDMTERLPFHSSLSLFTFMHWRRKWQPTPVFLPGESQGQRSLVAAIYGVAQSRTRLKWLSKKKPRNRYECLPRYFFLENKFWYI